ncbi:hypothetical protein CHU98_g11061 [Xylaria longipes]|nr:hypothetical protein CHU98_g11061 [Xylaria longipes]
MSAVSEKQDGATAQPAAPVTRAKCCIVCCGLLGFIIRCLPGLGEWWGNIDIHCASCDKHIATIPPDEEIQLVRVSNRPPLPTNAQQKQQQQQQPTTSPTQKK